MNVQNKFTNPNITINDYLKAYGVDDPVAFIGLDEVRLESPLGYKDLDKGLEFLDSLDSLTNIALIVDSDVDGYFSSCLAYTFLKHIRVSNIKVFFHTGKQHGLTDIMMHQVLNSGCDTLWIADASTNDIDQCEYLSNFGYKILITDHHQAEVDNPYATIINNQISPNISNKNLCGTGVTFKLIQAWCEKHQDNWYRDKLDMVAIANVADVMDMRVLENRIINYWGLSGITNPLLLAMCKKFVYKFNGTITPTDVGFSIAPKFNALCRGDDQELKARVFYTLCGEGDDIDDVVNELRKCHDRQTREVRDLYNDLITQEPTIVNNIVLQQTVSTPYTGLVANKLMDYYNRPIMLFHGDNKKYTGSCRSPVDLREYLLASNAMDFAKGHDKAFGIGFSEESVNDLTSYFENHPLDITPVKDVAFSFDNVLSIPSTLFDLGTDYKDLWGTELPEPLVYLSNVTIKGTDVKEFKGNTIKFKYGMIDMLKFKCSNELKEMLGVGQNKITAVNIIASPEWNEYNGNKTKQMIIKEVEVV